MVNFRVKGSHAQVRGFAQAIAKETPVERSGGVRGRVYASDLLGNTYDNATITFSYAGSTKRMTVKGPAVIVGLATKVLESLESASKLHMEGLSEAFRDIPSEAGDAVAKLMTAKPKEYEAPKMVTAAAKANESEDEWGNWSSIGFKEEKAIKLAQLNPQAEVAMGEIMNFAKEKLRNFPQVYAELLTFVSARSGSSVLDGSEYRSERKPF